MRVCVRAPTPSCPAQPSPPHPCHLAPIQALPFLPTPLQTALSASFNQGFPSLDPQYHFYLCTYSFLSWSLALRKNQVTREIFSIKGLTYCVEVTLPATPCSTKCCTLESCRSCLLHKHNAAYIKTQWWHSCHPVGPSAYFATCLPDADAWVQLRECCEKQVWLCGCWGLKELAWMLLSLNTAAWKHNCNHVTRVKVIEWMLL